MSNRTGENVANKYRFGKRKYVNTENNVREIITTLGRRGPGSQNAAMRINRQTGNTRVHMAQKQARMFAYMPVFGHRLINNIRAIGNIEAYFTSLGMSNANKMKVFKSVYSYPINANYPLKTNNNRKFNTNGYIPTPRNMNWFEQTNKRKWVNAVKANSAAIKARLNSRENTAAAHRRAATTPIPVNRPNTFEDTISLKNQNNWPNNRLAIRVNQPGGKKYYTLNSFNGWFGSNWKNMEPNSKARVHPYKTHPEFRTPVTRNQVRLVQFK